MMKKDDEGTLLWCGHARPNLSTNRAEVPVGGYHRIFPSPTHSGVQQRIQATNRRRCYKHWSCPQPQKSAQTEDERRSTFQQRKFELLDDELAEEEG